jgi:hypothetical protein
VNGPAELKHINWQREKSGIPPVLVTASELAESKDLSFRMCVLLGLFLLVTQKEKSFGTSLSHDSDKATCSTNGMWSTRQKTFPEKSKVRMDLNILFSDSHDHTSEMCGFWTFGLRKK